MNKEEFTLICSIQEILDRIKENGTTLSVVPFEEDMNVKWFLTRIVKHVHVILCVRKDFS